MTSKKVLSKIEKQKRNETRQLDVKYHVLQNICRYT